MKNDKESDFSKQIIYLFTNFHVIENFFFQKLEKFWWNVSVERKQEFLIFPIFLWGKSLWLYCFVHEPLNTVLHIKLAFL